MLSKNFQQRLGSPLNEKQSSRLERALEHYMSEVIQANPGTPVQTLNKEVLQATLPISEIISSASQLSLKPRLKCSRRHLSASIRFSRLDSAL